MIRFEADIDLSGRGCKFLQSWGLLANRALLGFFVQVHSSDEQYVNNQLLLNLCIASEHACRAIWLSAGALLFLTSPAAGSDLGLKTWKAAAPLSILPSSFLLTSLTIDTVLLKAAPPPPLPPQLWRPQSRMDGLGQGSVGCALIVSIALKINHYKNLRS